jgi:hypothetical protein
MTRRISESFPLTTPKTLSVEPRMDLTGQLSNLPDPLKELLVAD